MSYSIPRLSYAPTSRPANVPPATLSGGYAAMRPAPTERTLPKDVSTRFGNRLRELRRERNMTQLRMATDFGIDRSFISDVERGRKSISLPMLEVIALGMHVSLSDLLRDL
jgi:DNA-binding XRE family transcriptional regulator